MSVTIEAERLRFHREPLGRAGLALLGHETHGAETAAPVAETLSIRTRFVPPRGGFATYR